MMLIQPTTITSALPSGVHGGSPGGLTEQGGPTVLTPTTVDIVPSVTPFKQPKHQKDTTWTKLFVGGLPYHTTNKSLREHFEVFGDIEEAVVITDRSTGKSRGYGFVIMSTKAAAESACKEANPIIDGRKANVNLAILGAKPRGNSTAQMPISAAQLAIPPILPGQYGQHIILGAVNPYLQQLYSAQSPYAVVSPNLMQPMGMGTTGNSLLNVYAAQFMNQIQTAGGYQLSPGQQTVPVSRTRDTVEQQKCQTHIPGGYHAYAYSQPMAQQLSAVAAQQIPVVCTGLPAGYAAEAANTINLQDQQVALDTNSQ